MALDMNACLKAFSVAFCQYSSHPNEQTQKNVERQIDVSYRLKRLINIIIFVVVENNGSTGKYVLTPCKNFTTCLQDVFTEDL